MVVEASRYEPGARIDVVELGRDDLAVDGSGARATAIGSYGIDPPLVAWARRPLA